MDHILGTPAKSRIILTMLILLMALLTTFRVFGQVAMPDTVCVGSTKHYWVDPTIGSTYTWQINGVSQTSTTNEIYVTWDGIYTPSGSPYTISVQEKSAYGCYGDIRTGLVYLNPSVPVGILIATVQNPACAGQPVTFTANAINAGTAPVYNWKVNNNPAGASTSTFTYQPVANDVVTCEVTSNITCVTNNPAISLPITMQITNAPIVTFIPCFDLITSNEAKPFKLRGGLPLNGTYSGAGVNSTSGIFNPAAAPTGPVPITYSYTNMFGCSGTATDTILNNPAPVFTCGSNWLDVRDNNRGYATVQIGAQCWLAENLDYGRRIQSSQPQTNNCVDEKYCYNNDPANCSSTGALYQWDELMKYDDAPAAQGICPPGWHIPTNPEWMELLTFYNGAAFAGKPLQDLSTAGFHALPGGVIYQNNAWSHKNLAALFWTSTTVSPLRAISHGMNNKDISVSYYESLRGNAFPVRCLRDQ